MLRFIFLLILLPFFSLAKNSFLVAPGIVEFDLKKPITQSFIITNNGDETIRLSIIPSYFAINDSSLAMGKHLDPNTKNIEDITPFIRVSPKRLSLTPGQRRDIRISIRPKQGLPEGDYRSHLLVKMLEVSQLLSNSTTANGNSVGMDIKVKMETAVAIYGRQGQAAPRLSFECQQDPATKQMMMTVINPTPWRFDGQVKLTQLANQQSQLLLDQRLVSLRGSTKSRLLPSPFSKQHQYQLSYSSAKTPTQTLNGQCTVI